MSDPKCCRICLQEEEVANELITPCKCKGSMSHIHKGCLAQWHLSRLRSTQTLKTMFTSQRNCEVCHAPIKITFTSNLFYHHLSSILSIIFVGGIIIGLGFLTSLIGSQVGFLLYGTSEHQLTSKKTDFIFQEKTFLGTCPSSADKTERCKLFNIFDIIFLGLMVFKTIKAIDTVRRRDTAPNRWLKIVSMFLILVVFMVNVKFESCGVNIFKMVYAIVPSLSLDRFWYFLLALCYYLNILVECISFLLLIRSKLFSKFMRKNDDFKNLDTLYDIKIE